MNESQGPSPTSETSVTEWLDQIKLGEEHAAQLLWQRYLERLLRLASRRLANSPRGAADEEDVVLSAFDSFLRAAKDGRFPRLVDRQDLWQILVMLTDRKAGQQWRHERAAKRGAGKVSGDSAFVGEHSDGPIGRRCRRVPNALPRAGSAPASGERRTTGSFGSYFETGVE